MDIRKFFGASTKAAAKGTAVPTAPAEKPAKPVAAAAAPPLRKPLIVEELEDTDSTERKPAVVPVVQRNTNTSSDVNAIRPKRKEPSNLDDLEPAPPSKKAKVDSMSEEAMEVDVPAVGHPQKMTREEAVPKPKSSYAAFISRAPPPNLGLKEIPTGAPTCFQGKTFLITGVLDSISREQAEELIRRHGGDIKKSVVKKLDYAVVGSDAGSSKLEKIHSQKVKILSEDDLFALIRASQTELQPSLMSASAISISPTSSTSLAQPVSAATGSAALPSRAIPSAFATATVPGGGRILSEKHRPIKSAQLVGNNSAVKELKEWLSYWASRSSASAGSPTKPRACLLTGPPGIGKTTAATLLSKELGFATIEMNASDTRSKTSLKESVASILSSHGIAEFFGAQKPRTVLIMDEVDGMSVGDRGGLAELVQLIKTTRVPIICIANDKYKVRSLDSHCLRVSFRRPTTQQIQAKLAQIAFQEKIDAAPGILQQFADECHGDLRQAINLLQIWSIGGTASLATVNRKKDLAMGPFDAVPPLLSDSLPRLSDKLDRFFVDYSIIPLFIFENYLSIIPEGGLQRFVRKIQPKNVPPHDVRSAAICSLFSDAADSISLGDLLERGVRRDQHWELLPDYGVVSTIRPCSILKGRFSASSQPGWSGGGIQFPQWLGKNSTTSKKSRLLQEIQVSLMPHTGGAGGRAVRLDYLQALHDRLTLPLVQGQDGISQILGVMEGYLLQKDDRDSILELMLAKSSTHDAIPSSVKSALTRAINKSHWAVGAALTPRKSLPAEAIRPNAPELEELPDMETLDEQEDLDTNEPDKLIKEVKAKKSTKTKQKSKPSTNK